jgi:hypothetical protein
MSAFIDYKGKTFGRLTVIERAEDHITRGGTHKVRWLCKCTCGNTHYTQSNSLIHGLVKSCRCYLIDCVIARNKGEDKPRL